MASTSETQGSVLGDSDSYVLADLDFPATSSSQQAPSNDAPVPLFTWSFLFYIILGLSQDMNVDFLPITHQSALGKVGIGSTGDVQQSFVNPNFQLVFKRISRFYNIMNELKITSYEPIRRHPNICTLQGICWEVEEGFGVRPILVFEKAPFLDLERFTKSTTGQALNIKERLKLCTHIANALTVVHEAGVIHADVKPTNILVFQGQKGEFIAKLGDFGYSRYLPPQEANTLINLPESKPFNDPNLHCRRGYSFNEAAKMDMFSFGVCCLWLLFYNRASFTNQDFFRDTKRQDRGAMISLADRHLVSISGLDDDTHSRLRRLFDACLAPELDDRPSHMTFVHGMLKEPQSTQLSQSGTRQVETATLKPEARRLTAARFQLAPAMRQLFEVDVRVREMILECFKVLAKESVDDDLWSVYEDVCLQLAFCYRVGFGAAIDDDESHRWLRKSGMPERLDQQLLALRLSISREYQPWTQYAILYHEGHILASMDAQYYREQGLLASILATQEREIQDWKSVLSLTHWLVLDKVDTHINMLLSLGYLDNAEKLARETFNEVLLILPPDSLFAIRTRWNLARACVAQDKLAEAEYLAQKALTLGSNTTADLDDKILVQLDLLACIYSLQGKHEKAARLRERAVKQTIEALGEGHIQTIKVVWNLRELYFNQGSLSKATSVNKRVLQTARKSLGADHEMTLLAEVGFAQLLWRHRKWIWGYLGPRRDDNAGENLIEKAQILLGEGHPTSLTLMAIIAKKLAMKSRHDEAINLLTRVVEFSAQTAGPNSPVTIYHRKRLEHFKAIRKYYTFFAKLGSIRVGPWVLAFIKKPFWERQGLQHVWGPVFRR